MVIYYHDDVNDYKKFPSRELVNDSIKFSFRQSEKFRLPDSIAVLKEEKTSFEDFLKSHHTLAFLIIRNDTIVYEKYFDDYKQNSVVPAFSMTKSVMSILTGCAIDDGLIRSVNDPVTDYLPELKANGFEAVKIENLLQMTSGIEKKEKNIFYLAGLYYGRNLWKSILKLKLDKQPGTEFQYLNVNAILLGYILERTLKGKPVTQYLQEKIWKPLGMEYDASWSLDSKKDGMEKTFCCINACARDYAKIGRLYLDKGNWNGRQIVSEKWVENSIKIDTANASPEFYQYMWWLPTNRGDFMAAGKRGQFVYVYPPKNLIIVRLGEETGDQKWEDIFEQLASNY
jgi:CubicO group peptidase (beta-lactamase class C family)